MALGLQISQAMTRAKGSSDLAVDELIESTVWAWVAQSGCQENAQATQQILYAAGVTEEAARYLTWGALQTGAFRLRDSMDAFEAVKEAAARLAYGQGPSK